MAFYSENNGVSNPPTHHGKFCLWALTVAIVCSILPTGNLQFFGIWKNVCWKQNPCCTSRNSDIETIHDILLSIILKEIPVIVYEPDDDDMDEVTRTTGCMKITKIIRDYTVSSICMVIMVLWWRSKVQGGTCFAFSPICQSLLTDKINIIFPFLGICLQIKCFLPEWLATIVYGLWD